MPLRGTLRSVSVFLTSDIDRHYTWLDALLTEKYNRCNVAATTLVERLLWPLMAIASLMRRRVSVLWYIVTGLPGEPWVISI